MKLNTTTLAVLSALAASHVSAAEQSDQPHNNTAWQPIVQNLETVVVKGEPFAQKMGTQRITNRQIMTRPAANGMITDLLHDNPNVQFSNVSGSSEAAGEIAPENVSFHGEKFYGNNWMIDGMSNNDNVNPGADNGYMVSNPAGTNADDLPAGGTQSFWVNADIIDRADVYDSNISAKYGRFTGGVVDAKLKDPAPKASGSISYRTTRSSWAKYNAEGEDKEAVERAEELFHQPKFTKNIYSVNINQPLSEKAGILFSYNRTESDIPFFHSYMHRWQNQKRLAQTYVLKGNYRFDNGDQIKLTGIYSPHESTLYRKNYKDGAFTNNGGGYRFNAEWKHLFEKGQVTSYLGYKETQNKLESQAQSSKTWNLRSAARSGRNPYLDWQSSANEAREGGFGTVETDNKTWTAKQDYTFDDLAWGNALHNLSFGWQADWAQASYKRHADTYLYRNGRAINRASCLAGDDACLDGDQFLSVRSVYRARDVKANNNHYAAYFEDKINWGKWELTPGVRIDHDRFLKNTDIAPRLSASYDFFGNGRTKVFGGLNRYYSDSVLAHKLREGIRDFYTESRTSPTAEWRRGTDGQAIGYYYPTGRLKTPRSDEIVLGANHRWGDAEWTLKWVQRHGKNQFASTLEGTARERNQRYVMNNNGRNSSNTVTLSGVLLKPLDYGFAKIRLSGGAKYARNKSNTASYDTRFDDDYSARMVLMDGKLISKDGTKATDYNNPWDVFANVETEFPKLRLTWAQRFNYRAGYTAWSMDSNQTCSPGLAGCGSYTGPVDVYTKERFKNELTVDWRFTYKQPVYKNQTLDLTLDVINVFNSKGRVRGSNNSNSSTSGKVSYRLGRQFWLGARYNW